MQDFDFYSPKTLDELVRLLEEPGGEVVAGGTDLLPRMRRGIAPSVKRLVSMSGVKDLSFIRQEGDVIRIGALTTHQELVDSELLLTTAPVLVKAAASIGCPQTRNRGTLGGNLANASPAADTIPALFVLNSDVQLYSRRGFRTTALPSFLLAPGKTSLDRGEVIHSVSFPVLTGRWGASFLKMGKRNGMSIAIVSASAVLCLGDDGKIVDARAALGSVASTVVRMKQVEDRLVGDLPSGDLFREAAQESTRHISPISDIRASEDYRRKAAVILMRRALQQALENVDRGGKE